MRIHRKSPTKWRKNAMRFPTVAQPAAPSSQRRSRRFLSNKGIMIYYRLVTKIGAFSRSTRPAALARTDFSREECGPATGSGKERDRDKTQTLEFLSSITRQWARERATILPFYHLFLLAGGCRANGKRRAQETRDRTAIRPDSRIPVAINHLAATFQQFENDLSLSLSLSLLKERTNETLDGDGSRFSNISAR